MELEKVGTKKTLWVNFFNWCEINQVSYDPTAKQLFTVYNITYKRDGENLLLNGRFTTEYLTNIFMKHMDFTQGRNILFPDILVEDKV